MPKRPRGGKTATGRGGPIATVSTTPTVPAPEPSSGLVTAEVPSLLQQQAFLLGQNEDGVTQPQPESEPMVVAATENTQQEAEQRPTHSSSIAHRSHTTPKSEKLDKTTPKLKKRKNSCSESDSETSNSGSQSSSDSAQSSACDTTDESEQEIDVDSIFAFSVEKFKKRKEKLIRGPVWEYHGVKWYQFCCHLLFMK